MTVQDVQFNLARAQREFRKAHVAVVAARKRCIAAREAREIAEAIYASAYGNLVWARTAHDTVTHEQS